MLVLYSKDIVYLQQSVPHFVLLSVCVFFQYLYIYRYLFRIWASWETNSILFDFWNVFFFCIQSKMYKIFVSVNHHWKRCVAWGKWEMSGRKRGDIGIRPIDNSEWEWKLDSLVAHSWHYSYITYVYDNRSDMAMTLTWTEMSFDDRLIDISIADLGNSPAARCFSRAEQFWSSPRPRPSRWALRADADRNPSVQWHRVQRVNAAK